MSYVYDMCVFTAADKPLCRLDTLRTEWTRRLYLYGFSIVAGNIVLSSLTGVE